MSTIGCNSGKGETETLRVHYRAPLNIISQEDLQLGKENTPDSLRNCTRPKKVASGLDHPKPMDTEDVRRLVLIFRAQSQSIVLQPEFDVSKNKQNALIARAFSAPKGLPVRLIRYLQRMMRESNDGRDRIEKAVKNVIFRASTKNTPAKVSHERQHTDRVAGEGRRKWSRVRQIKETVHLEKQVGGRPGPMTLQRVVVLAQKASQIDGVGRLP